MLIFLDASIPSLYVNLFDEFKNLITLFAGTYSVAWKQAIVIN